MVCIYCGADTRVTNSRHQKRANNVWRRRHCVACNTVFSTIEAPDTSLSMTVRKYESSLEPFIRDKLFVSVYESLKHRNSALMDATSLTSTILSRIYQLAEESVIDSAVIVTVVISILERFDGVAATHYTAYHPIS
jgi:transcriptional repressor NrdR